MFKEQRECGEEERKKERVGGFPTLVSEGLADL